MAQGAQGLTPEMQQKLMQLLQGAGPQGGGPGAATSVPMAAMPPAQPRPPQVGAGSQVLPSGTAAPMVPGVPVTATPSKQGGGMRASGLATLPMAVIAVKQKMTNDKVQKVRALAGQYIALQSSQDPTLKQAAQALISDPKNHKLFSKAVEDPASPEAQGIQLAYKDLQGQDEAKMHFQEMQAKIQQAQASTQAEQQRAGQEQAHGRLYDTQAAQEGQVTPAKQADITQKNQAQAAATERISMQVKERLTQASKQADAMIQVAKIRADALESVAGTKPANAKGKTPVDLLKTEYQNINTQLKTLQTEATSLQKDIDDHPIVNWFSGEGKEKQGRVKANLAQQGVLRQQLQTLEHKRQLMLMSGALPDGAGNSGTKDEPIIISPEDMQ